MSDIIKLEYFIIVDNNDVLLATKDENEANEFFATTSDDANFIAFDEEGYRNFFAKFLI